MMVPWPPPTDAVSWLSSSESDATARRPSKGARDELPASEDAFQST